MAKSRIDEPFEALACDDLAAADVAFDLLSEPECEGAVV
jgi:hypothetical protein